MEKELFKLNDMDSRVRHNMNLLWLDKKFCDFTITVNDDCKFSVHKIVLAACSEYFKSMFQHETIETQSNTTIFNDIHPETMEAILQFCYSSELLLNNDNVQEILVASHKMRLTEIETICVKYIKKRIDIDNCLGILTIADQCKLNELHETSLNFCLDKFTLIIDQEEFLQLEEENIISIISRDELNVEHEETVLDAILKWINHDSPARASKIENLISHVRLVLLDMKKLVKVINYSDLIYNSIKCRDLIDEAKNYLLLRDRSTDRSQLVKARFKPRVSIRKQQRIYAVGGWTNEYKPIKSAEKFDPYLDTWVEISPMTRPRCGVGVAILDESLYAIGGHDGTSYLKSVERLDIIDETWHTDVAEMRNARTSIGIVALGGYIYAIGGQFGTTNSDRVERYDPRTNTWEVCVPMQERRLGPGLAVLNGLIYVVGGSDSEVLDTVECFDPEKNSWSYVAPLITARKHLGCASVDGKIYAVGGRGATAELHTAECYDSVKNEWRPVASMSKCRSGICLVELDGLLYAAGGHNGDSKLNMLESYDPKSDEWTIRTPMIHDRLGAGLAVYSKLRT